MITKSPLKRRGRGRRVWPKKTVAQGTLVIADKLTMGKIDKSIDSYFSKQKALARLV